MVATSKGLMHIGVIGAQANFVFHWPAGTEGYGPVIEVTVPDSDYFRVTRLYIAYGYREAFGHIRRRILVFRSKANVLAEFVGVDNWTQNRQVATFLRRDGSKRYLRPSDHIPSRYKALNVVHSRSVVTGPYAPQCLTAVVDEADLPSLVAVAIARDEGEKGATVRKPPGGGSGLKSVKTQLEAGENHAHAIVNELLTYRSQQKTGGPFTRTRAADEFLRHNPFAFLMAASIDRGALAESVWEIPFLLRQSLGHLDPGKLSRLNVDQVETILRSLDRQPRFPRQAAQTIVSLSRLVVNQFCGNATSIWENKEPGEVVETLERIWGVGPGIAHMTVRILIDEFGYNPGPRGLKQINIKPDAHVMRVFYRTGLAPERNGNACVQAAQQLYPAFPGLLDWPAWEIGRSWCHEHNPECVECPLHGVCLKIDT